MLEAPRTLRRRARGHDGGSAALYVNLARPRGGVVARYHRSGLEPVHDWVAAAATRDGHSLAVAVFGRSGNVRLEVRGEDGAEAVVDRLLAEWRRRGRPTTADLDVTVTYGPDGTPRTRLGWRRPLSPRR
jgi:hypothetical protein